MEDVWAAPASLDLFTRLKAVMLADVYTALEEAPPGAPGAPGAQEQFDDCCLEDGTNNVRQRGPT